jgi:hypothetical protein
MATIVLLLGLLGAATVQDDAVCLGFIQEGLLPLDVYVAGTEFDGFVALAKENDLVYVNGPGLGRLKAGETYRVVRPVGRVKHPVTAVALGIYYRELATVKVESVGGGSATASVAASCQNILKGDLVLPLEPRAPVRFSGDLSGRLTPVPGGGLSSVIVFGLDDRQELAEGQVCFIGIGARDGVKVGDRFMICRTQPAFEPQDLALEGSGQGRSYEFVLEGERKGELSSALDKRVLPERVMGDLLVLRTSETTSVARIINSRAEIRLGDLVVRR